MRTRSRDRREYCVRIFKGAITDFDQKRYSPEEYLEIIASLSDLDLKVAGSLYVLQKDKDYRELGSEKKCEIWEPIRDRISREREVDKNAARDSLSIHSHATLFRAPTSLAGARYCRVTGSTGR